MLKKIFVKYRSFILYAVFGILTTIINIVIYNICYTFFPNSLSNIIAWFLAVLFAFVTNKLWVFESKEFNKKRLIYEMSSFFSCRLLTGVIDLVIMIVAVDICHANAMVWKIIANIIVILLNYVASKLVIFKKGDK